MANRASGSKRGRVHTLDFSDVDLEGGGAFHIPEGDYLMEVMSVEEGTSKNDNDQFRWKFKGKEKQARGKTFFYYTTLTPDSLWKLGRTLKALGLDIGQREEEIDLDELVGLECIGVVVDDRWEGKMRSKLQDIMPADGEPEEEERKPSARISRGNAKRGNGGDEKIDAKEVGQMAEEELADLVDKHGLDVDLRKHKTLRRKADAVCEALEQNDLLA